MTTAGGAWWELPECVGADFNVVHFPSERLGEGGGAGRTYNNYVGVLRFYIGIGLAGFASTANKVQPVH